MSASKNDSETETILPESSAAGTPALAQSQRTEFWQFRSAMGALWLGRDGWRWFELLAQLR
ncbi:MAG: hypothetical protein AAF219_06545 [Myxococcota bacterium]